MIRKTLEIKTEKRKQIIDITDRVEKELKTAEINSGICSLFILHTTAAITTADLDPGTDLDFLDFLEKIKPEINYRHPHNPTHAPDHILSSIIGASLAIPFENNKLILGTWQRVVLVELDGPRNRQIIISIS